jgi:hypothetical protein
MRKWLLVPLLVILAALSAVGFMFLGQEALLLLCPEASSSVAYLCGEMAEPYCSAVWYNPASLTVTAISAGIYIILPSVAAFMAAPSHKPTALVATFCLLVAPWGLFWL